MMIRSRLLAKKNLRIGVMAIAIRIGRRIAIEMQSLIVANRRQTMAGCQEAPRTTSEDLTMKISHGALEKGTATTPRNISADILATAKEIDPGHPAAADVLDHLERREANIGVALLWLPGSSLREILVTETMATSQIHWKN